MMTSGRFSGLSAGKGQRGKAYKLPPDSSLLSAIPTHQRMVWSFYQRFVVSGY